VNEPNYTSEEVDAAVAALQDPERLRHAQDVVVHAAPGLQRVLNEALAQGGYFSDAHEQEVMRAAGGGDPAEQIRALRVLLAEETRLGMLVGVAVGFELAHELQRQREA
jgi:SpoVK/Ycf46/Vps4 family AAA+-type ATPase